MKILLWALVLTTCVVALSFAQRGGGMDWVQEGTINCCIKSVALDAPSTCKKLDPLACQNAGGKKVKDCSECK
jgi:hypothetical protein